MLTARCAPPARPTPPPLAAGRTRMFPGCRSVCLREGREATGGRPVSGTLTRCDGSGPQGLPEESRRSAGPAAHTKLSWSSILR